jgi:NOL1/NOP2/sun family putative RNA methylase
MQQLLVSDFDKFIASLNETPPVSIRINSKKKQKGTDDLEQVPWCPDGKYLKERPVFTLDPTFHAGAYYVQEASSMFLSEALSQTTDITQPLSVLDLCAAPGGKSTHLLSLISAESLLVSNEVIRSRAAVLSENIQKWGYSNVLVTNNDPEHFKRIKGFFDVIVVDAPCSGEGLFRKEPEATKEWSPENIDLCSKRQRRILSEIWPSLKSGGLLIYCTCTYNRFENEDNLQWLIQEHDAEFLTLKTDPAWGINEVNEGAIKGYHFYPHLTKGEGFFMAAIRKTGEQASVYIKPKNKFFQRPPSKVNDQLAQWITSAQEQSFLLWKENILMTPLSKLAETEFIAQQLHVVSLGTTLAELKHEKLIPHHAGALSIVMKKDFFPSLDVTKEQALQYLRKETLQLSGMKKGFSLVTYEGLPIGWANVLDNRINNMYPANWRIRMGG